jgi:hypothetical protein
VARLLSEETTDFSYGALDSAAPTAFPKTAVAALFNGRIQPDSTVQRRPGTIRLSAATLNAATGYGGAWFTTAAGVDQFVAIFGAQAFYSVDYGATWVPCLDGSGDAIVALRQDYYSFATMRVGTTNYLFAANGATTVQRWNGLVWDTLPNAPSGVKFLACFNGRLYATGHSGVLVQASAIGAPQTWASPDGLTVQVRDTPTGLFQVGPHLLVWDSQSTSYIDGFGEQTIIVAAGATGFSRSVGCMGFRTVVGVGDNAVCWLSRRGVEYYSPSSGITLMSRSVQSFLLSIDWSELYANPGRMSGAYDDIEQNFHLALSTNGTRNNRVLVLNLRENAQWQRSGPTGACAIDQLQSPIGGDVSLGTSDGMYLDAVTGGSGVTGDANGYLTLAANGFIVAADLDGYLEVVTDDTVPATLFSGPDSSGMTTIYSLGYDGFVRRHSGATKDDELFGGTGGTDVTMTLISRPFLLGRPRQRKRVRAVHVSAEIPDAMSLVVAVRGGGVQGARQTIAYAATGLSQSRRGRAMVNVVADEPQVECCVTNDAKISLLGVSAELLREQVA